MNEKNELVLVLDFGGQYNQLIARSVRDNNIYCEVKPYNTPIEKIRKLNPVAIIFTGGPHSIYLEDAPSISKEIFDLNIPVLGICYGAQFMVYALGGEIKNASGSSLSEFGRTQCTVHNNPALFNGVPENSHVWMSHNDYITKLPDGFKVLASTSKCPYAAFCNDNKRLYGLQFHPEVNHTEFGKEILHSFLYDICGCKGDWTMRDYVSSSIEEIRSKVGDGKVLLALSGGVDSSVCCALLEKAIGSQLTCIFVDHGFMRKNEGDEVEKAFGNSDINFIRIDASERFLNKLAGVSDPESKRKIIGEEFIRVFEAEAKKIGQVDYFAQGTIYPDIIESGVGDAAVIKSHHNVGGLPDYVDFKEIIEPLKSLFKDEVRRLGTELSLADTLVWRQPFPGPGLAVRVIGEITREKLDILREADFIFRDEIANAKLDRDINQYFAVLTDMRSVGVMGDSRTYDYTLALRAVTTSDFMTADFAKIPYDVLQRVSTRIVNEVQKINRICYDITSKPPATIEWE